MSERESQSSRTQMNAFTMTVLNELKDYGVDLTNNASARGTIQRYFKENPQSTQMSADLMRTLLGYAITTVDPLRLINLERQYFVNHGLKLPPENNQTLNMFFNNPGTGVREVYSYSPNALAAFDNASRFLFSHLVKMTDEEKRLAKLVTTAYNALAFNNAMMELYRQGQTDTPQFTGLLDARNRTLGALGFRNLDKIAGAGSRPDNPLLVDADTPDKRSWNINMFNGFLAPILLTAERSGLITLDQAQHAALDAALRNDFTNWGYNVLGSFLSPNAANYLISLRRNMS